MSFERCVPDFVMLAREYGWDQRGLPLDVEWFACDASTGNTGYPCIPRPRNFWTISMLPVTTRFFVASHVVDVQIQSFDLMLPSSC